VASWFSRFTNAVAGVLTGIGRAIGGAQPEPTPSPGQEPSGGYGGDWGEDAGDLLDEDYEGEPYGGPFPPGEEPDWYGNEVQLEDDYGDWVETDRPMTVQDWLQEALRPKEYLLDKYGIDNIDILRQLQEDDLIGPEDWDQWRTVYDYLYG
jgi:hypothetical protein